MLYRKDKNGNELSMLGFGCMRFARKGNGIDMEKAEEQIMAAFRAGVNYYDTAYIYPGSEAAIGEIFERNQIRDKINIATKLPQYMIKDRSGLDKYFNEELSRLRTSYVDYYLMHHLTDLPMWEKLKDVGILDWIKEKKASGAIRNIGFSYHGNTDNFQKILNDYDWDFCQIQYNYLDEVSQAGVDGLRAAAAKGIPVVIMEPLRGGKLVNMLPAGAKKVMQESGRGWSPAEWSFRWLYNQPEVTVVLSGMNSLQMVEENCRTASEAEPGHRPRRTSKFSKKSKKSSANGKKSAAQAAATACPVPKASTFRESSAATTPCSQNPKAWGASSSPRPSDSQRNRPLPPSVSNAENASSTVPRASRSARSSRRRTRPCVLSTTDWPSISYEPLCTESRAEPGKKSAAGDVESLVTHFLF